MSIPLSPLSKLILKTAKRIFRDKTSVVMTRGMIFDAQFASLVRSAVGCNLPDHLLHGEMEFLVKHEYIDVIIKDDKYGPQTRHYVGDAE